MQPDVFLISVLILAAVWIIWRVMHRDPEDRYRRDPDEDEYGEFVPSASRRKAGDFAQRLAAALCEKKFFPWERMINGGVILVADFEELDFLFSRSGSHMPFSSQRLLYTTAQRGCGCVRRRFCRESH
jgi:hypothetical protein